MPNDSQASQAQMRRDMERDRAMSARVELEMFGRAEFVPPRDWFRVRVANAFFRMGNCGSKVLTHSQPDEGNDE